MFVNDLYLTLVLHPGRDAADRTQAWVGRLPRASRVDLQEEDARQELQDAGRDLLQHLGRDAPRVLSLYARDGITFSEPLEMLRLVLTGERQAVPLIRGHLAGAIYDVRVIFGREALEIRGVARSDRAQSRAAAGARP